MLIAVTVLHAKIIIAAIGVAVAAIGMFNLWLIRRNTKRRRENAIRIDSYLRVPKSQRVYGSKE
jgi:hypothetical protein